MFDRRRWQRKYIRFRDRTKRRIHRWRYHVSQAELVEALRKLVGTPRECIFMHSSMSACGKIDGGAPAVINAVHACCQTLCLPAHTYSYSSAWDRDDARVYDPVTSPSKAGHITEVFRSMPGVVRSIHPTHSLAAHGPLADELCEGHDRCETPCGAGTPYEKMIQHDTSVLMFGTTMNTYTLFHTAEDIAKCSYLYQKQPYRLRIREHDGQVRVIKSWRQNMAAIRRFKDMDTILEAQGLLRRTKLGGGEILFLPSSREVHNYLIEQIHGDPCYLLADEGRQMLDMTNKQERIKMNRVYGSGIIGAGAISGEHCKAYQALKKRVRMVGVADINPHKLRELTRKSFIPFTTGDYKELLRREDVDLVSICTPPNLHEEMVIAALQAGKYVICEKPIAHTLASADRIIAAARQYPGKLSVNYQLRYQPEIRRTIWLRDLNKLGKLSMGRFGRFGRLQGTGGAKSGWWGAWDVAGGGVVMTQFIHELDLMIHVFGPAREAMAVMDTQTENIPSEDTCAAVVRFADGAIVSCCCSAAAQKYSLSFDIIGDSASTHLPWNLNCADKARQAKLLEDALAQYPLPPKPPREDLLSKVIRKGMKTFKLYKAPSSPPAGHIPYIGAVLDAMDAGQPLPIGPTEARASLELAVAIYSSALSGGKTVSLPLGEGSAFYNGIKPEDYRPSKSK